MNKDASITMRKRCPNCGFNEHPLALFCSICATRLVSNQAADAKGRKHGSFAFTIVSVAVLAFVVLVLWSAFPERKHQATGQPESFLPSVPAQHAVLSEPIPTIVGRVVAVTDGDTITVIGADGVRRVRIAGIDAPEIGQDFGVKAKRNLSALLNGQTVTVFGSKNDDYGRVVGKVVLDGRDVGLELIKSGFAWHFKRYEQEQSEPDRKAYSEAESLARLYALELWSLSNPIAPWDYRNGTAVSEELKTKFFGNKNSFVYHWWGCPGFLKISLKNRVVLIVGRKLKKQATEPRPTVPKRSRRNRMTQPATL